MSHKICIIGLGYVGLPLAVAFGKKFETLGFDVSEERIIDLNSGIDKTLEVDTEDLKSSSNLTFTFDINDAAKCNFFIVTVPTPIDAANKPDLSYLQSASHSIGKILKRGDCVIYESTTYPGCTREFCAPILESQSGLKLNEDFYCGYSPERINPGDKTHRLENILKIVSGSNSEIATIIQNLYSQIISAGIYVASSLEVAEAAKVIENSQRDLNIAFVNELSLMFDRFGLNTSEVLDAASTKWNFLNFKPGLVGGHCIGVDPYYLTHKAETSGYLPEVILAGRRVNDSMAAFVANKSVKEAMLSGIELAKMKVSILGLSFKENCPDIRNSKVFDIISTLESWNIKPNLFDDWVDEEQLFSTHGLKLSNENDLKNTNIFILATPHETILSGIQDILDKNFQEESTIIIFDVKGALPSSYSSNPRLKVLSL